MYQLVCGEKKVGHCLVPCIPSHIHRSIDLTQLCWRDSAEGCRPVEPIARHCPGSQTLCYLLIQQLKKLSEESNPISSPWAPVMH